MAAKFSDAQISAFLSETKVLPRNFWRSLRLKDKRGHKEWELDLVGAKNNQYRLILRLSDRNPLDFSAILVLQVPNSNTMFRLCRYNGKSHEHTNSIEGQTFYGFHVHKATERYQELGAGEDAFAEPSHSYGSLDEAVRCMVNDGVLASGTQAEGSLL